VKRRVARTLLLSLAVSFSSGVGPVANAQPSATGVVNSERASVSVRLVGEVAQARALEQRIASWFEPGQFEVEVQTPRYLDPRKVLLPARGVEVWVTLRDPHRARLYFATLDPQTHKVRYLLRDLALEGGLDEVGAETLAQAVHLSTVALLEGQDATPRDQVEAALESEPARASNATSDSRGSPPTNPETSSDATSSRAGPSSSNGAASVTNGTSTVAAAPTPSRTPISAEPREREPRGTSAAAHGSYRWVGALGYGVASRGAEGLAHGPTARVGTVRSQGWGGALRLQLALPRRREWQALSVELWNVSAAVTLTFRAQVGSDVLAELFTGPALELVRFEPQSAAAVDVVPARAATELRPELVLGLRIGFAGSLRLLLVPELQVALHQARYEVRRGSVSEVVADAPRLVPAFGLEVEL
jgi:hypothetical protein